MELELDCIKKQFKNKIAVDRVSFRMRPGIYGLLGANGAGKTTLMRMMAGILRPDEGRIHLALQLCNAAKDAGADAVKFQT